MSNDLTQALPEITPELLAMVNRIKACKCGDRHICDYIARDSETKSPLFVHHSLDYIQDLHFVSPPGKPYPGGPWHSRITKWAELRKAELPKLEGNYFRHFKGGRYKVLTAAINTVTLWTVIIYKSLDRIDEDPWVRNYENGDSPWNGTVEHEGQTKPRFEKFF